MAYLFLCKSGNRCSGRGSYNLSEPVAVGAVIGAGHSRGSPICNLFAIFCRRNLFGAEVVKALRTFVCTICPGRMQEQKGGAVWVRKKSKNKKPIEHLFSEKKLKKIKEIFKKGLNLF